MVQGKKEIHLRSILVALRHKIVWIMLITILCGLGTWIVSSYLIKPQYKASVSLYVYSSLDRSNNPASTITSSELDASQSLVDTYIVILQSNTVLNQVIKELELDITPMELCDKISASSINGTEVLSISVTDTDPELAQQIANAITRILPDELVRVVKAGGVEVVDHAEVPTIPSSPNISINTMAGILFGLLFSSGGFLLSDLFSRKICGEEDLSTYFDIPVVGVIPQLNVVGEDKDAKN